MVDLHEHPADGVVEPAHAVADDSGQIHKRRFHDDRSRCRYGEVGDAHEVVDVLLRQFDGSARLFDMAFELLALESRRDGQEKARLGALLLQDLHRLEHVGQKKRDLLPSAAGQEQHGTLALLESEKGARRLRFHIGAYGVDERVAEEGDVRARRDVGADLVMEDRDDLLGDRRALLRTPLAPCPSRRRDVGKDGDAECLRLRRKPPVEVGIVDDEKEIGLFLAHGLDERLFQLQ